MKREITSDELKAIQLDILRKVHRFCIDNGIKYSITAGTLLGAVRHHGFIPWDDDIDICMLREDYNKFIKIFPANAPKNTKLLSLETDRDYPYLFAKVMDERTVLHESVRKEKYDIGVNIDVFPYDDLPDVKRGCCLNVLWKRFWAVILWRVVANSVTLHTNAGRTIFPQGENFVVTVIKGLRNLMFYPIPYQFVLRMANRYFKRQYENATYLYEWFWSCDWSKCYRKSVLDHTVLMEFEGEKFCAMSGWNEYLCAIYGDYMTPPPEGQARKSTHEFVAWWKDGQVPSSSDAAADVGVK